MYGQTVVISFKVKSSYICRSRNTLYI